MKNTILIEEEEYPLSQLEEIYSFQKISYQFTLVNYCSYLIF